MSRWLSALTPAVASLDASSPAMSVAAAARVPRRRDVLLLARCTSKAFLNSFRTAAFRHFRRKRRVATTTRAVSTRNHRVNPFNKALLNGPRHGYSSEEKMNFPQIKRQTASSSELDADDDSKRLLACLLACSLTRLLTLYKIEQTREADV